MRRISLAAYFTTLTAAYIGFGIWMFALFGAANIVTEIGGAAPPEGILSGLLYSAAGWFSGDVGRGLFTLLFFLFSLIMMFMTLRLGLNLLVSGGRSVVISDSPSLTAVDSVLSFLESFIPARTMKEVAGDVREALDRLHQAGASPQELYRHLAMGILWILLDAAREATSRK